MTRDFTLERDKFPDRFEDRLLPFNEVGVLPPADYQPTREDFEATFVEHPAMPKRQSIYAGWNDHREALRLAGLPSSARQLLNGSFTTAKANPGDLDVAVEVPVYGDGHEHGKVIALLQGPGTKADYACDAYPILSYPPEHPFYERVTRQAIRYWSKWFGQTRSGDPKGRVWATAGGFR